MENLGSTNLLKAADPPPETPLISVIIPAYQAAGTLGRAIDSALRQDYPALEVIVVDDGSTDNTRALAAAYAARDGRVRYYRQDNRGCGAARNFGAAQAAGAYLALLDADDEWLPDKLRLQAEILNRYPAVGLVFANCLNVDVVTGTSALFFDTYQSVMSQMQVEALTPYPDVFRCLGEMRPILYQAGFINPSTVMLRSSLFKRCGGFVTHWLGPEDLDLWLRVVQVAELAYCTRQLGVRRLQVSSGSRHGERFIKQMIAYYQMCLTSSDYADLRAAARQGLRRKHRHLIFYYGRHSKPQQAWNAYQTSLADGRDWLTTVCALAAWLGPQPFRMAGRLLWP